MRLMRNGEVDGTRQCYVKSNKLVNLNLRYTLTSAFTSDWGVLICVFGFSVLLLHLEF